MMRLLFIGTGYVGLVSGTCFADFGNDVTCFDIDKKKIDGLQAGSVPIYEPGLSELVEKNVRQERLRFTTDISAIKDVEIIFICVGTPPKENGEADLQYLFSAAKMVGSHLEQTAIIVVKSTVPVGTAKQVKHIIQEEMARRERSILFDVVSNPEFLKEGAAIKDFQNPDRIVVGASSAKAREALEKLYHPISRLTRPIMFTTEQNAELIKYASNAMLATRISFMNELSALCDVTSADIKEVAKGIGLDSRIGPRFLQAGCGYGGSCFPKDVKATIHMFKQNHLSAHLLEAVEHINEQQKRSVVSKLQRLLPDLKGKTVAIWGLSFKPRTDDIREAPSITVIKQLLSEGANVRAYDPEGKENTQRIFRERVQFSENAYDAVEGVDALLVLTEWDEFREPDFDRIRKAMKKPIIVDGRNIYEPDEMQKHGFSYAGIGR